MEDSDATPGDLPEKVWIKSRTRTFNSSFVFALSGGRIWFRPNTDVGGLREPWRLLDLTGLPSAGGDATFEVPARIEAITADADELVALADTCRFHFLRHGITRAGVWRPRTGVPTGTVVLDPRHRRNRDFSLGRRNADVLYWEDPVGNPHHWGRDGISTLYVLSEDGREVTIFDTGLPADFSRHIGGPERGAFVAEGISASASTIFLIDAQGVMYTRLADFDTLGCNPMFFNYSYTVRRRPHDRGEDPRTLYSTCRLPPEGWQRQPPVPLLEEARISRDITILQNGNGNAARELRVAGTDPSGRPGHYWKALDAQSWSFRATDEEVEACRFLDRAEVGGRLARRAAPSADARYRGELHVGRFGVTAELLDFNLFCGPATLRLSDGAEHVDLTLFTVDAWTYARRDDPGRDGTPRVFLATLRVANAAAPAPESPLLAGTIEALRRRSERPDAYVVRASTTYVTLRATSLLHPVRCDLLRANSGFASVRVARIAEAVRRNRYQEFAMAPYLGPDGTRPVPQGHAASAFQRQKLALNRHTLAEITAHRRAARRWARIDAVAAWVFSFLNLLARVTLVAFLPRVRNLSRIGGVLLHAQARTSRDLLRDSARDFDAAQVLLRQHIVVLDARYDARGRARRRRLHLPGR
jgi:hypothetical protein